MSDFVTVCEEFIFLVICNRDIPLSHRFILHELHLQTCDLRSQGADLLTGFVLIHHHFVLDVASTVGIFQSVEGLHEVSV